MKRTRSGAGASSGVTLAELLVVVSIVALAITVAVPLIGDTLHAARIRTSAEQLSMTMRAVRMLAVTHQQPRTLRVAVAPSNWYEYVDAKGRTRRLELPAGVRIVAFEMPPGTPSTAPVTFRANGSLGGGSGCLTRIEAERSGGAVEVWEVTTNALGMTTVTRRIE